MNIRVLTAEDASVYREIRLQALSSSPNAFLTTYSDYASRLLEHIAARLAPTEDSFTLGAYASSGQLAGTVTFVRESAARLRHIANVFAMFVLPQYRRHGIGQQLLADLIARARQVNGLEQLKLSVVLGNDAAVGLYRSLGFQAYGVEPHAMKTEEGYIDEIHMVLPLFDGFSVHPVSF